MVNEINATTNHKMYIMYLENIWVCTLRDIAVDVMSYYIYIYTCISQLIGFVYIAYT